MVVDLIKLQRVFIALPVALPVAENLLMQARSFITEAAKPVAPENHHITLAFIGALSPEQLDELTRQLPLLANLLPVTIQVTALRRFPHDSSPILAAVIEPSASLQLLYAATRELLESTTIGASFHDNFRPHITLVRSKRPAQVPVEHPTGEPLCFTVDTLGIYEGQTTPSGYRYQCLFRIESSAAATSG